MAYYERAYGGLVFKRLDVDELCIGETYACINVYENKVIIMGTKEECEDFFERYKKKVFLF